MNTPPGYKWISGNEVTQRLLRGFYDPDAWRDHYASHSIAIIHNS